MSIENCEECRATFHLLQGAGGRGAARPARLPALLERTEPEPVRASSTAYDVHAQKLVLRRRGYEAKLLTTPAGPEHDIQQGIVDGLQIAIDLLKGEGVEFDDPPPKRTRTRSAKAEGDLGVMELVLLGVLVARGKPTSRELLCILSGYAPSGPMHSALKCLRDNELMDGPPGALTATSTARSTPRLVVPKLPHGDELVEMWIAKLRVMEGELLKSIVTLARKRPGAISNEEVQNEAGYRPSGPFHSAMKRLRNTNLIVRGTNRPVDELVR